MPSFFLAVLIAVFIALYTTAGWQSISAKEWLLSGIPAWLQGLGTAAVAYLGWKAFAAWREEDAGRRKALCAEELVRAARRLVRAIRAARIPDRGTVPELTIKIVTQDKAAMEDVGFATEALQKQSAIANYYGFDPPVLDAVHSVILAGYQVQTAFRAVLRFMQEDGDYRSAESARSLDGWLQILVSHRGNGGHVNVAPHTEDVFEAELEAHVRKVEVGLAAIIVGKE